MLDTSTVAQLDPVKEAHFVAKRAPGIKTGQGVAILNELQDLVVLPFKATVLATGQCLTFEQALAMLHSGQTQSLRIERSYPGAPDAIGWTVFEHTPSAYLHKNEPLFREEKEARRHIRKVYAIRQDLNDDILTVVHLNI